MTAHGRGVIRLTHAFKASAECVFDVWVTPEMVARWLLPHAADQVTDLEIDPRVGGSIRFVTHRAGRAVEHSGRYLEIQRPHRLAFIIRSSASAYAERVAVHIEPRGAGCFLSLTSEIEPAPLQALAPLAALETCRAKTLVRPRWPTLEAKAALSLGLHLAMLPPLLLALREPPPPPTAGAPPALTMMAVDIGIAYGAKLPPPSPAAAQQPPAPARQVPHAAASRSTLPLPPPRATRPPNRTASNQVASIAPPRTAGASGTAGEDGDVLRHRARAASTPVEPPFIGTNCVGTIDLTPDAWDPYRGQEKAPVQARFFRDRSGKTWIRFTLWPRAPWTLPVTIGATEIRWTGVYGSGYALQPAGSNHLTGLVGFSSNNYAAKIDFDCTRSNADAT